MSTSALAKFNVSFTTPGLLFPNFRRLSPFQFADLRFAAVDVWQFKKLQKRQETTQDTEYYTDVSENSGFSPQIIHFNEFSIINHPFWGSTIFGNTYTPGQLTWQAGKSTMLMIFTTKIEGPNADFLLLSFTIFVYWSVSDKWKKGRIRGNTIAAP